MDVQILHILMSTIICICKYVIKKLIFFLCFSAGIKVILHSESVNYNNNIENELFTYFREGRSLDHNSIMLNKSSYVPPILAVLFFNGQASFKHVS